METHAQTRKPLHPLAWIAGIALVLFSAVGIGAFMGWIPTAMGDASEKPAPPAHTASTVLPERAITHRAHPRPSAPVQVASAAPEHDRAGCAECGVVESVREVDTKGEGSGLGVVGGAVLGGVLGHQVGGGHGKDLMTVVGAVGGAMAGNEVEKRVKATKSYSITVRFTDGSTRAISETNVPTWHEGDKVRVVDGVIRSNA